MWKEINHKKYVEVDLTLCIRDGRKVYFWTDNWVYMMPLVSFMEADNLHFVDVDAKVNLHFVSLDAKVHDFISHETKKWNIHSISTILPLNVISDIREIPIPCSLVAL